MYHNLRDPSKSLDLAPALKYTSLMSAIKFADANYITVLTTEEELIYDECEVKF